MPYTTVATKSVGDVLPASHLNGIRSNQEYFASTFPHCNIKESTAQSVPTAAWTAMVSDEENSDIGGMHSTVTNTSRITIPSGEGGLYRCSAALQFVANGTGNRFLGIGKNGASPLLPLSSQVGSAALDTTLNGTVSMVLVAGDYLQCMAYHTVGVNLNVILLDFYVEWRATA